MPKLDLDAIEPRRNTIYPGKLARIVAGRTSQRLGDAGGLTQFGVNLVTLAPGAQSSIRHWHEEEDEFVMILDGEIDWMSDEGATRVGAGDFLAFPRGDRNAHCFVNAGEGPARFVVVGHRARAEVAHYPDIGLKVDLKDGTATFRHEDGRPYEAEP